MLTKMFWRGLAVILASTSIACGSAATLTEPSPSELLQKASANMLNAKTAHIEGTGGFAISSGPSISFDFKLIGDAGMPDKYPLTTQIAPLGQTLSLRTLTSAGRAFT